MKIQYTNPTITNKNISDIQVINKVQTFGFKLDLETGFTGNKRIIIIKNNSKTSNTNKRNRFYLILSPAIR